MCALRRRMVSCVCTSLTTSLARKDRYRESPRGCRAKKLRKLFLLDAITGKGCAPNCSLKVGKDEFDWLQPRAYDNINAVALKIFTVLRLHRRCDSKLQPSISLRLK